MVKVKLLTPSSGGAKIDTEDMVGDTPLHAALLYQCIGLLTLLHHGACVRKNQKGLFPHQVVRGHMHKSVATFRAHMYKGAKKSLTMGNSKAIDIAKLNISRRKLRVNGLVRNS